MSQSFWHQELDCPIVYVAGVCLLGSDQKSRASYGLCWGFKDPKNKSRPVKAQQSVLRAELSGLVKAMKIAYEEKIPQIVIRMKSERIDILLDEWDASNLQTKSSFPNADVLFEMDHIRAKAKDYMYWLTQVAPFAEEHHSFSWARHYASLNASGKFDVVSKKSKSVAVAIFGACSQEGQKNPKASWATVWADGDVRNEKGAVDGKQTHLRAEYCALRSALRMAVEGKHTKIHILTRNVSIKHSIEMFNDIENNKKQIDPIASECKILAQTLEKLTVEHIPASEPNLELDEAKAMAKEVENDSMVNVCDYSMTMDSLDQMILNGEGVEETDSATPRKKNLKTEKTKKVAMKTSSQETVTQQRPLRPTGFKRSDGVDVVVKRT